MKQTNQSEKAREYAFLLLKYRPRSAKEITERLKRKKFDEGVIAEVVSFLKDKSFLDDRYFAKAWIESRINKPLGLRRLRQELKIKGISQEIIDSRFSDIRKNYNEEEVVSNIAAEKIEKLRGLPPQTVKRRIFSYLSRRGFSTESIINALNKL